MKIIQEIIMLAAVALFGYLAYQVVKAIIAAAGGIKNDADRFTDAPFNFLDDLSTGAGNLVTDVKNGASSLVTTVTTAPGSSLGNYLTPQITSQQAADMVAQTKFQNDLNAAASDFSFDGLLIPVGGLY